ncbi:MAG: ABC transporter ATP-binding protein [Rhodobacteraceae bacterium]|nr:ABC transporter ATP-binding protein [Paracoccaceae bacterium]
MSITVETVFKRFGGADVLSGLSFSARTGEFFVVLGPSGCGKSTLLRLIAGLEESDGGRIALDGRDVSAPGLHVPPEARRVGVVFQSYALWPHMTVADNVAFPMEGKGRDRKALAAEVGRHLATVSLDDLAARRPAELSGGQRQRVALARCLASGARTILMDEPLANLDPHLRGRMEEELVRVHGEAGATTLYITHDQREAMALATRVAVMQAGRFEQVAPPEEVHDRPATETVARFVGRAAVLDGVGTAGGIRVGPLMPGAVRPPGDGEPVRAVVRRVTSIWGARGRPGSRGARDRGPVSRRHLGGGGRHRRAGRAAAGHRTGPPACWRAHPGLARAALDAAPTGPLIAQTRHGTTPGGRRRPNTCSAAISSTVAATVTVDIAAASVV